MQLSYTCCPCWSWFSNMLHFVFCSYIFLFLLDRCSESDTFCPWNPPSDTSSTCPPPRRVLPPYSGYPPASLRSLLPSAQYFSLVGCLNCSCGFAPHLRLSLASVLPFPTSPRPVSSVGGHRVYPEAKPLPSPLACLLPLSLCRLQWGLCLHLPLGAISNSSPACASWPAGASSPQGLQTHSLLPGLLATPPPARILHQSVLPNMSKWESNSLAQDNFQWVPGTPGVSLRLPE